MILEREILRAITNRHLHNDADWLGSNYHTGCRAIAGAIANFPTAVHRGSSICLAIELTDHLHQHSEDFRINF